MAEVEYTTVYDLDYFNGSQMFIYVGDVWVDEVTFMSYTHNQSKSPIYGYASQLWDDVAPGQVIVHGNFSINFKEQGYLWAVLRRYFGSSQQLGNQDISGSDAGLFAGRKTGQQMPSPRDALPWMSPISRASIERISSGDATRDQRFNFYNSMAGYASWDTGTSRDNAFEDIMETFEDQIWNPNQTNQGLNSQLRRVDQNAFDGFDIYCVWGDYSNERANHTVQKIIGVRLTSVGKRVQTGPGVIQEEYSFIAQTTV